MPPAKGAHLVILALESSCDETAVAIFDPASGLLGEWVHSQIALHEKHGGDISRIEVSSLTTVGRLRALRPRMAVTQWRTSKPW